MIRQLISVLFTLFIFCACTSKTDTKEKIGVKWSEVNLEKFIAEDTIIVYAELDLNKEEQTLLINIPLNIYFKAYSGDKLIAENSFGNIYNLNKTQISKERIPIIAYNKKQSYSVEINQISSDKLKFEIYKPGLAKNKKKLGIDFLYASDKNSINYEVENFFSKSQLPIIKINTKDRLSDKKKIVAGFKVIDNKDDINKLNDSAVITGLVKIKIRGSSSKLLPKRSYLLKTYNDSLKKEKKKLLGLPKEREWVLYAPFIDYSLMRNVLGYKIHREMGNYSPRTKYCHLIINNDYRGIYVLTERIKRGENRVNIAKSNSKDPISGGYIIKIDKGDGEAWKSPYLSKIDSGYEKWFIYVYPKSKNLNQGQRDYIRNYVTEFETALLEGENWEDYIEIQSFIDYMILMEVMKNVDGYRLSTFYSKDKGGKLKSEPLWDLNLTFGLTSYYDGYKSEYFMYDNEATPFWWEYLIKDLKFRIFFKKRWSKLRQTILSEASINKYIEEEYEILESDVHYNTEKWLSFQESNNWRKDNQKNFKKSIDYLKAWIKKRNNYLDQVFSEL